MRESGLLPAASMILSSPHPRAWQTAEIATGNKPEVCRLLEERNFGEATVGKTWRNIFALMEGTILIHLVFFFYFFIFFFIFYTFHFCNVFLWGGSFLGLIFCFLPVFLFHQALLEFSEVRSEGKSLTTIGIEERSDFMKRIISFCDFIGEKSAEDLTILAFSHSSTISYLMKYLLSQPWATEEVMLRNILIKTNLSSTENYKL